ncbi:hypothetical protein GCM10010841_26060 [Deinococcus aerophilus]|uniref:Uncharacterized protein n=1 Tax=Deinococcus aerophilus TaxID=522488 RepID=A0ABQ2GW28_9DEIO|nr:hypothetical protein GCM10010841_26060 [Deinococcus aerophilus]
MPSLRTRSGPEASWNAEAREVLALTNELRTRGTINGADLRAGMCFQGRATVGALRAAALAASALSQSRARPQPDRPRRHLAGSRPHAQRRAHRSGQRSARRAGVRPQLGPGVRAVLKGAWPGNPGMGPESVVKRP